MCLSYGNQSLRLNVICLFLYIFGITLWIFIAYQKQQSIFFPSGNSREVSWYKAFQGIFRFYIHGHFITKWNGGLLIILLLQPTVTQWDSNWFPTKSVKLHFIVNVNMLVGVHMQKVGKSWNQGQLYKP